MGFRCFRIRLDSPTKGGKVGEASRDDLNSSLEMILILPNMLIYVFIGGTAGLWIWPFSSAVWPFSSADPARKVARHEWSEVRMKHPNVVPKVIAGTQDPIKQTRVFYGILITAGLPSFTPQKFNTRTHTQYDCLGEVPPIKYWLFEVSINFHGCKRIYISVKWPKRMIVRDWSCSINQDLQ